MAQMVCTTYVMGYLQYFLFGSFDEGRRFGIKEGIFGVICSGIYAAVSYLFRWFGRNIKVTAIFFIYMLFAVICAFIIYKIKREADTVKLNRELENFKKNRRDKEP